MNMHEITLSGCRANALGSGALWLPTMQALVISDMHLGKSERFARRGGTLLPPYETRATLGMLSDDVKATGARTIISLGDSFDDDLASDALSPEDTAKLEQLITLVNWVWITGNHDPAPTRYIARCQDSFSQDPFVFRHIAEPGASGGFEISGHYHPKFRLHTRAGTISRAAFIWDENRMIMPAYGHYTGGLDIREDAIRHHFSENACVVLTGPKPIALPAYRELPSSGPRRSRANLPLQRRRGSFG